MKKLVLSLLVSTLSVTCAGQAIASPPHFAPAGGAFVGEGVGYINGNECRVEISGYIGPDVGASEPGHSGHAHYAVVHLENFGPPAVCDGKEFVAKIKPNGDFKIISQVGLDPCAPSLPLSGSAALSNLDSDTVQAVIAPMAFGFCSLAGVLNAGDASGPVQIVN